MITIDYTCPQRMKRYVRGDERWDTYYPARCACGNEWDIRKDNIKRTNQCQQCARIAAAKLGYEATKKKYGPLFALGFWREWRLANPTCLERTVIAWLDALGVSYEREYWFVGDDGRVYLLDFLVNSSLVIEVNGSYWHDMPEGIERDERKARALHYAGFPLLTLSEADVNSGRGCEQLRAFLATQTTF